MKKNKLSVITFIISLLPFITLLISLFTEEITGGLQILCVFMDNAIQHSKNNSLIEIEVIATEKNIAFSVADHGQGISDEDKQYIFDRFYSGDKSHTNKSNFGLGLSIAKELTQMLNGTITINDTAGGGATFTVKFPLK
jgi:two-component system, OmpR family, sensor histidine kinase CiaH